MRIRIVTAGRSWLAGQMIVRNGLRHWGLRLKVRSPKWAIVRSWRGSDKAFNGKRRAIVSVKCKRCAH